MDISFLNHFMLNNQKTLLIIGSTWCEPNSSAAGHRMRQIMDLFLADHWHLIFASTAAKSPHRQDLTRLGIAEIQIQLNHSSFDIFIEDLLPTAVLFDRFMSEEQFGWRVRQYSPQSLLILDSEDLHSLRHTRHLLLKTQLKQDNKADFSILTDQKKLYQKMIKEDMTKREVGAIYRCDICLIISLFEMKLLTHHFLINEEQLFYLPFLFQRNPPSLPTFEQRKDFIWMGNFRHQPNWDAVLWLKQQIWPAIKQALPQANLNIYGAYPPKKATDLNNKKEGFHVHGWIESEQQAVKNARIYLAPLRFGAGLKGKLFAAMHYQTPSITTPIGAEGINQGLEWGGKIEQTAEKIAQAAVDLYQNKTTWQRAQQNGQQILNHHFDLSTLKQDFMQTIYFKIEHLSTIRQQNFIGQLLQHHQHQSTRYMALWIEAKNR